MRECYEQLYTNKLDYVNEMDRFLETQTTRSEKEFLKLNKRQPN